MFLLLLLSLYDLANIVPTLAKFYHQASEAYEQACTRHISMIIYYVSIIYFLFPFFVSIHMNWYPWDPTDDHFFALESNLNAFFSLLEGLRT